MIKYWIKLWSTNLDYFENALTRYNNNEFDFIELYIIPWSFNEDQLKILKKIPISLHWPHSMQGFNPINPDINCEEIWDNDIQPFINFFNPPEIILHPELWDDFDVLKRRLLYFNNNKILIENMPKIPLQGFDWEFYGYTIDQLKCIHNLWCEICLDFWKATKSAISQKLDPFNFIRKIIDLFKPIYFHISWFDLKSIYDQHNDIKELNMQFLKNIKNILNNIARKSEIKLLFETPKKDKLENDFGNIEYFKNF